MMMTVIVTLLIGGFAANLILLAIQTERIAKAEAVLFTALSNAERVSNLFTVQCVRHAVERARRDGVPICSHTQKRIDAALKPNAAMSEVIVRINANFSDFARQMGLAAFAAQQAGLSFAALGAALNTPPRADG